MEPLADTVIEDERWQAAGLAALADRAAAAVLVHLGLPAQGFQLAVMGCGDARIAELNAGFRGKAGPTNVLSWPSADRAPPRPGAAPPLPGPGPADDPAWLGDIAIAFDTCAREAGAAGKPLADHATHLLVHATLHLLGYDHERDADAELMEATEAAILSRLGLGDPYA